MDATIHHFVKAADDYLSDNEGNNFMLQFGIGSLKRYFSIEIQVWIWFNISIWYLIAVDAALIFRTEADLDQTLYYLIGNSYVRVSLCFL